jgi:hypothetical protein
MLLYLGEFDPAQGGPDDPLEIDAWLPTNQPAVNAEHPPATDTTAADDPTPNPPPAPADR